MVTKVSKILAVIVATIMPTVVCAQENRVVRMPEIHGETVQKEYTRANEGFWMSADVSGGYSCRLTRPNIGYSEIDVAGGYRFNEYLRVGVGVGARYYFDRETARRTSSTDWGFPLYLTVRGNFIPTQYRTVVPFYAFDFGTTVKDGVMIRPTVGLRIGQMRSAFIVALSYVGQFTEGLDYGIDDVNYMPFVSLRLGYEF
jgi:hypothetical protein